MEKVKKLKLRMAGRTLLKLKLQETPRRYNSLEGEVDIIFDAANRSCFDMAAIQTRQGRALVCGPVNYVSWHGFYALQDREIRLPVINFHHNRKVIKEVRHRGTVKQKDIFFFPICSVYIPADFPLESVGLSKLEKDTIGIELHEHSSARVDFFVLPKGVSAKEFIGNFTISAFYFFADITVFDKSRNGELCGLPVNKPEDSVFSMVNIGGWDVFVRVLYTRLTREPELCNTYSILFHDPNDAIEMLLNRRICRHTLNGEIQEGQLERITDIHGEETRIFVESGRAR